MNRQTRRANRRQESIWLDATIRTGESSGLVALAANYLSQGRPRESVKLLKRVLAREPAHAGAHDGIAMAYQVLGRPDDAVRHFSEAISFGVLGIDALVRQSPAIIGALGRFSRKYPRRCSLDELLGANDSVAQDCRLLALLQSEIVRDVELELFLTAVRRELLSAVTGKGAFTPSDLFLDFGYALAEQCFLNEYVWGLSSEERALVAQLTERVVQAGAASAPTDVAVLGCYLPLHSLRGAEKLLDGSWPKALEKLLTLQVRDPLAEASDAATIPALTAVDDETSLKVQQQYEENPYPRWFVAKAAKPTTLQSFLLERFGLTGAFGGDILIAGCGTGEHSTDTALNFPQSSMLAVDISRASLAYARRKTRELGIRNVEYAQADILKLGSLDRRFDFIESVGVLHHLSDPEAGWRVLRGLLRPGGVMRIALYSEIARRPLDVGRALIAERGYGPSADDIRVWRQELIHRGQVPPSSEFFSTSNCRDLIFHVMEHRFTLPRIQNFLKVNRLSLLGLETSAETQRRFMQENPGPAALTDLDRWHEFELAHTETFAGMYYLWAHSSASPAVGP